MKWSEDYTSQLDTVHAPADLKQRLYAMEAQADPADAPRFAPQKQHKTTRVRFGRFKGWQVAAALAVCVGLTALLPVLSWRTGSSAPMENAMEGSTFSGGESSEMALDAYKPENVTSLDRTALADAPAGGTVAGKARSMDTRKIIYTANLTLESTEYDETCTALEEALTQAGGYVQKTEEYTRPGDARSLQSSYRVPAAQYQSFLQQISQAGNLIRTNETTDDVTAQYVDTKARVDALTAQRDRLLDLQNKADNLADLLAIEEQLTQAQYELESWQQQLNLLLNQTDYCTVNLELYEVKLYTPTKTSLLQRIGNAFLTAVTDFGDTLSWFLLWVIGSWPWLVLIGAAAYFFLRGRTRPRRNHRNKPDNNP